MQANIRRMGDVTVVDLSGSIDFDTAKPFREKCLTLIRHTSQAPRLLFNMQGLRFVGSSGISSFIQTLKEINQINIKPRFCGVGSEFKKMFLIYSPEESFRIFPTEEDALSGFEEPSY